MGRVPQQTRGEGLRLLPVCCLSLGEHGADFLLDHAAGDEEGLVGAFDDQDLGSGVVVPGEVDALVAGGSAVSGDLQALGLGFCKELLVSIGAEPVEVHWGTSIHSRYLFHFRR